MIRRVLIGLCAFLAIACLILGPISRMRDIFLWESDNAPSRYYRAYDNRPWKHVRPEYHRDLPDPAAISVGFCEGRFRVDHISAVRPMEPPPAVTYIHSGWPRPLPVKLDIHVVRYTYGNIDFGTSRIEPCHAGQLTMSPWLLAALFGSYPMLAIIRGPYRRHRRRRKGLCLTCGYNLTGNTTGICPECGKEHMNTARASPAIR